MNAFGGDGNDRINQGGGKGRDRLRAVGGAGNDRIKQRGGKGRDRLRAMGGDGHDNIKQRGGIVVVIDLLRMVEMAMMSYVKKVERAKTP